MKTTSVGYKLSYISPRTFKHIVQRGIVNDIPTDKVTETIENLQKQLQRQAELPSPPAISWQCAYDMVGALIASNEL